jgi:hypothetical protein
MRDILYHYVLKNNVCPVTNVYITPNSSSVTAVVLMFECRVQPFPCKGNTCELNKKMEIFS